MKEWIAGKDGVRRKELSPWEQAKQEREIREHAALVASMLPGGAPLRNAVRTPLYPPVAARQSSSPMIPNPEADNSATRIFVADTPLTVEVIGREVSKAIHAGNFSLEILTSNRDQALLLANGFTLAGTVQRNVENHSVTFLRFRTRVQSSGDGVTDAISPK
jgi:hypothetical protein